MRRLALAAGATALSLLLLAGCSTAEEPDESPTPIATAGIPENPGTNLPEEPSETPTPTPTPTSTSGIPDNGVDPNGLDRDEARETEYLDAIGFSHESPREDGKTYVEVIADGEGTANTRYYYLNIGYEYCAQALEDTVSEPKPLFDRLLADLAKKLDRAVEDPVIQKGYSPVLNMALGTLCAERWQ